MLNQTCAYICGAICIHSTYLIHIASLYAYFPTTWPEMKFRVYTKKGWHDGRRMVPEDARTATTCDGPCAVGLVGRAGRPGCPQVVCRAARKSPAGLMLGRKAAPFLEFRWLFEDMSRRCTRSCNKRYTERCICIQGADRYSAAASLPQLREKDPPRIVIIFPSVKSEHLF